MNLYKSHWSLNVCTYVKLISLFLFNQTTLRIYLQSIHEGSMYYFSILHSGQQIAISTRYWWPYWCIIHYSGSPHDINISLSRDIKWLNRSIQSFTFFRIFKFIHIHANVQFKMRFSYLLVEATSPRSTARRNFLSSKDNILEGMLSLPSH